MRWNYAARAPKILWDLLFRGRYDFTFDLVPMQSRRMSVRKRINLLRTGLNLAYRRPKPWAWPIHMQIEITSRCNLHCPVCPCGMDILHRDTDSMDMELFKQLISEVGPYLLGTCLWGWGEPLLNPQFPEMVRLTNSYGPVTVLSTNGQCLNNPRVLEGLISEPPTYLIVAIDGLTDETNSKYRVGAKLAPIMEGVAKLNELKRQRNQPFPIMHMRYIVMKHNQHELPEVQPFATSNQFDMLTIRGLSLIDADNSPHRELMPDLPEYRAYNYDGEQRQKRSDYVCMHAFCLPGVFADGTVVHCDQDFNGSLSYGKMGNGVSFADLWFSDRAARTRKTIRDNRETFKVCQNCPFADHTSNTCSFELHRPDVAT